MPYDTTLVADRHLLDGVAHGEADALRALYQRHGTSIYALAYGMLVDPGDAEEVVAETFAHLWRSAADPAGSQRAGVRQGAGHGRVAFPRCGAPCDASARRRRDGSAHAHPQRGNAGNSSRAGRSRARRRPHRPRQARHTGGTRSQGRSVGQPPTLAVAPATVSTNTVGAQSAAPLLAFPAVSVLRDAG